jgi:hypothetical protein
VEEAREGVEEAREGAEEAREGVEEAREGVENQPPTPHTWHSTMRLHNIHRKSSILYPT